MSSWKLVRFMQLSCIVSGLCIAIIPATDEITGSFSYQILALPLLLCIGIYAGTVSIADRNTDNWRAAVGVGGIGVLLMALAAVVIFESEGGSVAYLVIFVLPVFAGYSGFVFSVAYLLWTAPNIHISRWIPVLLITAPIIDPIANGVWVTILPAGISVIGLVWVYTGFAIRPSKVDQ